MNAIDDLDCIINGIFHGVTLTVVQIFTRRTSKACMTTGVRQRKVLMAARPVVDIYRSRLIFKALCLLDSLDDTHPG
ncbi:hypothetical protein [Rugamonas rivuli]|uniref:Uncharacterized protein n=1 Tax=Rugamonas rivuli TaxID=2743358 RepID=A0A843S740_9BURK|nr:hypothetical protein [Rugamonas rivuli]MQA18043.1 hypothetical protein [Rugamonas rivuli]